MRTVLDIPKNRGATFHSQPCMLPNTCLHIFLNEFLFSYTLLSSNDKITLPAGLALTISNHGINWDLLGSPGTLAVIPSIAFALYVQRYLVSGLRSGAVKQ